MFHKVTLTIGTAKGRPYHAQCACSSAGDFATELQATNWYARHVSRIGPTETSELYVPGAVKKAAPVAPKPPAPPPPKVEAKK